jgi:hypothetical protein
MANLRSKLSRPVPGTREDAPVEEGLVVTANSMAAAPIELDDEPAAEPAGGSRARQSGVAAGVKDYDAEHAGASAKDPRAEWDRARDALIDHIDAIRGDLDWGLRRKIRDLLALVADLVLLLPGAATEGQAGIKAEIEALLGQVAALKGRLQG